MRRRVDSSEELTDLARGLPLLHSSFIALLLEDVSSQRLFLKNAESIVFCFELVESHRVALFRSVE